MVALPVVGELDPIPCWVSYERAQGDLKMKWTLCLLASLFSVSAFAASYHCSYNFMGAPIWSVTFYLDDQGNFLPEAEVLIGTNPHKEPLTIEAPQANETLHGWLSKHDANSAVEVFIYKERQASGLSKLINPRMPIAKEVWGDCQ